MAPADSAVDAGAAAGEGVAELPKVFVTPTLATKKANAVEFDEAARVVKTGDSVVVMLAAVTVVSAVFISEMAESVAALPSAAGTTRTYQVTLDACSARAAAAARRASAVVLTVIHDEFTPSTGAMAPATPEKVSAVAAAEAAAALGTDTVSVMTTRGTGVAVAALEDDELADCNGDAEAELLGDRLGEAAALDDGLGDGVKDGDALGEAATEGETGEALDDAVTDGDALGEATTEGETGEALDDAVSDGDTLGVAETVGETPAIVVGETLDELLIDADRDAGPPGTAPPGPPLERESV
jgi:hypothetical protein